MTIRRILVAIDDSPAALHAARVALELAASWQAEVTVVTVARDHTLGTMLAAATAGSAARAEESGVTILDHVRSTARSLGLTVETVLLAGEPFRAILDQAHAESVDMIVMGRSHRRGPASPYIGSVTAHVLEFAECPVLVVPLADTSKRP